jgi:hypothetical protein
MATRGFSSQERMLLLSDHAAQTRNKQEYTDFVKKHQEQLEIVATTTATDGRVYDWIKPDSQVEGSIAEPPPPLTEKPRQHTTGEKMPTTAHPKAELEVNEHLRGPAGTVPVPRKSLALVDFKKSLSQVMSKTGPPDASGRISTFAAAAEKHWYASSAQFVKNYGGQGRFSLYNPTVETNHDFSLLQLAIINQNGAYDPSHPRLDNRQTVEAGWIRFPASFGDSVPHLFTFFTTVGYETYGDYIQSWDQDYKGWVQYDSTIFPGTKFSPFSVEGGVQYDLWIEYELYNGNWWLWVKDRWIGYYPASVFSAGHIAANTLADHADQINFYGEIFDSNDVPGITTTDMGSGRFPETHWQHSAYIRNIMYQPQPSSVSLSSADYDGGAGIFIDDPARYRIEPHFKSGTTWGSYVWLGGPGAG